MTRRHTSLIPGLALASVLVAATAAPAGAAALPCQVPGADRHHIVRINLDGDRAKEFVDVFNLDVVAAGATEPMTKLMVCNVVNGALVRANTKVIWGPGPGNPQSGLRDAWVGDLDRTDGRVEVAARNSITASAGEALVILRQSAKHALTFSRLQTISADTVTMTRPKGKPAYVTAFVKFTHSIDGKAHSEIWSYSTARQRWVCTKDCFGRPTYTMSECSGKVPGQLGTAAVEIRVLGMTCTKAKGIIAKFMAKPSLRVVDGFAITSPQRYRVLGRSGTRAFWFAIFGTD